LRNWGTRALSLIQSRACFNVHILSSEQESMPRTFVSLGARIEKASRALQFTVGSLGVPLLDGCLASFECRVASKYGGGDYVTFVAEVEMPGTKPPTRSSASNPAFRRLAPMPQPAATPAPDSLVGARGPHAVGSLPD
jgi:flavin reductase (DIM6/NTAB) family NADH-FMN oxidoreductase RutF